MDEENLIKIVDKKDGVFMVLVFISLLYALSSMFLMSISNLILFTFIYISSGVAVFVTYDDYKEEEYKSMKRILDFYDYICYDDIRKFTSFTHRKFKEEYPGKSFGSIPKDLIDEMKQVEVCIERRSWSGYMHTEVYMELLLEKLNVERTGIYKKYMEEEREKDKPKKKKPVNIGKVFELTSNIRLVCECDCHNLGVYRKYINRERKFLFKCPKCGLIKEMTESDMVKTILIDNAPKGFNLVELG